MAIAQNPLTGQMHGAMGNFVTSTLGGQNIIRAKAFNQQDAKTESQVKQRTSFKMIAEEYVTFGGVTDMGFPEKPKNQSAYNLFMAANLPGAIDSSGSEAVIDYSKLVVANGSLPQPNLIGGTIDAAGITISYQSNMLIPKVSETDEVVAVLKTTIGEVLITRQPRGNDSESFISIAYPTINIADVKCCYLFVRSMDGKKASKSVFVALTS
ncbi:MAG TPA: DUF6266 family protein [Paludibacter sp.]